MVVSHLRERRAVVIELRSEVEGDEHFQLKELAAGSLDGVEGEFVYHEAFEGDGS